MTELTLWDVPPYQAHSETSLDAAISMSGKTKNLRELVFDALRSKPMTDEELSVRFGSCTQHLPTTTSRTC